LKTAKLPLIIILFEIAGASDWPQFQRDHIHSGISMDRVPDHPVILWSRDVHRVSVTPVVFQNTVYVFAENGSLWAFDENSGDIKWCSQMAGWIFQTATPACDGERIFAASDSGTLSAFDIHTGDLLWNRTLTEEPWMCSPACADGLLIAGRPQVHRVRRSFRPERNEWRCGVELSGKEAHRQRLLAERCLLSVAAECMLFEIQIEKEV